MSGPVDATHSAAPLIELRSVRRRYGGGEQPEVEVLRGVDGISFNFFTSRDVVRHPLVAKIVRAYDARDGKDAETGPTA